LVRVKVAFRISLLGPHEDYVWHQVNQQPGIQFDVGVDGADVELAIL